MKPIFAVSRSFSEKKVSLRFKVQERNFGNSVFAQGSADITCEDARSLAAALIAAADAADMKAEKKAQAEARRKAWRDREIAAGRMKVLEWRR